MKIFVLLSGGLDSATCLSLAIKKYDKENVSAVSINYGQKHDKELNCAKAIAFHYGIEHFELNLSKVFSKTACALMKDNEKNISHNTYAEQIKVNGKVDTYVPFRNGLFLSALASYTLSRYPDEKIKILIGVHSDDSANNAYADCSKEFINTINKAIQIGTYNKVEIEAPFVNLNKSDIVKKGKELFTPFALTWSCYEGGEKPCGKCATCIDRQKAFEANNAADPLIK